LARAIVMLPTIALLGSVLLPPQGPEPSAADQTAELFALLDRLDPLDTSALPFVRVAVGQRDLILAADPWTARYRHGFLLAVEGPRFRVRWLEPDAETLVATPPGTPDRLRVGFEPADLRAFADELAAALHASAGVAGVHPCEPDEPLAPSTVALLAARACARRGHGEHVERLVAAVRARHGTAAAPLLRTPGLAWDLAKTLQLALGDPRRSWQELREQHIAWLAAFDGEHPHETVTDRGNAIRRLLARRAAAPPRAEPPTDAQLLEDVRELPARREWPVLAPLDPAAERAQRAFDELACRGLAAVPALIDALDDGSPTRCIEYSSRLGGGFSVRTLGERADDVLVAIAGERRADWRAWYATARREGLRASVQRALERGVFAAATAWLRHWPDEYGVLVARARTVDARQRYWLGWALLRDGTLWARLHGLALLYGDACREHPERRAACELLLARGDAAGFRSIAADWSEGRLSTEQALPYLVDLLAAGVAVLPLVRERLGDARVRSALLRALAALPAATLLAAVPGERRAEARAQVRECALELLADATRIDDVTVTLAPGRRVTMRQATHAEVAACRLHELWPDDHAFDATRSARSRARQVAALRDAFGIGADAADATATPAERLVHEMRDGRASADTLAQLEALGLPALPWIEEALRDARDLPELGPRAELDALARRLVRRVAAVTYAPSAAGLTAAEREPLTRLRGEALTAASLFGALAALGSTRAGRVRGVELRVERGRDGEGTTIHCELCAADREPLPLQVLVTAGSLPLANARFDARTAGELGGPAHVPAALAAAAAAIDKALGAKSTTPVAIVVRLAAH
jgi:hypothetical protein